MSEQIGNVELEQQILGALLTNNGLYHKISGKLKTEMFLDPVHQDIWKNIATRIERDHIASPVTLKSDFETHVGLGEIGGPAYLARLAGSAMSSSAIGEYVRELGAIHQRRTLLSRVEQVTDGLKGDLEVDVAKAALEVACADIIDADGKESSVSLLSAITGSIGDMNRAFLGEGGGLPSGLRVLDDKTGGLWPADLIILAGRPSMGKTAVAVDIARRVALAGNPVVIVSLEMTEQSIAQRLLSQGSGVAYSDARKGNMTEKEFRRVVDEAKTIQDLPISLIPPHVREVAAIYSAIKKEKARLGGLGLVVVDYLQLVRARGNSRTEQMTEVSIQLKHMAKMLDAPVIALSQLSRQVESRDNKRPVLSDLRECLPRDTLLVNADTGARVSIADVKAGDRVLSKSLLEQTIVPATVTDAWSNGEKPIYEIVTSAGRKIKATENHPFFTERGWVKVSELRIGEDLATQMGGYRPNTGPSALPPDLCRLLGFMVGDGTYKNHREVAFVANEKDIEVIEDFKEIVMRHFPTCKFREWVRNGGIHVSVTKPNANGHGKPYGNPFREWLRDLGILGQDFKSKQVPAAVFESGTEGMAEFVSGYLHTDGTVKLAATETWRIAFASCSRELLEGVQSILDRLGIPSTIGTPEMDERFRSSPLWCLNVCSHSKAIRDFCAVVPLRFRKGRLLSGLDLDKVTTGPGAYGLPRSLSVKLAADTRLAGMGWKNTWRDQGKRMRRDTAREWSQKLNTSEYMVWADSDIRWEEIISITPAGLEEVFDLRIEGTHSFVANGFVVHNSGQIEQDADVVIFCYRDHYYLSRETPPDNTAKRADYESALASSKNVMELIVAKQRMGAIGTSRIGCHLPTNKFWDLDEQKNIDF